MEISYFTCFYVFLNLHLNAILLSAQEARPLLTSSNQKDSKRSTTSLSSLSFSIKKNELQTSTPNATGSSYADFNLPPKRLRKSRQAEYDEYDLEFENLNVNMTKNDWVCDGDIDYCTHFSSQAKNWRDAYESCISIGGTLLIWIGPYNGGVADGVPFHSWSSLFWNEGRWHDYDEERYSPSYRRALLINTSQALRYIAEEKLCFAINSPDRETFKSGDDFGPAGAFDCNSSLPYLCTAKRSSFEVAQYNLSLPIRKLIDIRIEKIAGESEGSQLLRCTPKFETRADSSSQRPFHIVWVLDRAYYPALGTYNYGIDATLPVPNENFTKYACEVRYLGSIYGNRSREIEISVPDKPKLAFVIRLRKPNSQNWSFDYSNATKQMVDAINNRYLEGFNLTQVGDELHELRNSEVIVTTFFRGKEPGRPPIDSPDDLDRDAIFDNFDTGLEKSDVTSYFAEGLRNGEVAGVEWFAVERCPFERGSDFQWAGLAGQEVRLKLGNMSCYDEHNYVFTRTCQGSLISRAQWVEPFTLELNCSRKESPLYTEFCPEGYTLIRSADGETFVCITQITPRPWIEAMDACIGEQFLPEYVEAGFDTHKWMRDSMEYITRHNDGSIAKGNLLWLPSRRRVPGGPLYPYSRVETEGLDFIMEFDWETDIPIFSSISDEMPIRLNYADLDASGLCLAWSITDRTLTTRNCSEKHPTLSFGLPVNSGIYSEPKYYIADSGDYPIPECQDFGRVALRQFGIINSCYKVIRAPRFNATSGLGGFTWEEAQEQCKKEHKNATLAIPTPYIRYRIANDFRTEAAADIRNAWLGIRQSENRANSSCRFLTSVNNCADPIYNFDVDNDYAHGVFASIRNDSRLNLQLPGTRITGAICQVDFESPFGAKSPVAYHLHLDWVHESPNSLRLYITQEVLTWLPGLDYERILKRNWLFVKQRMLCFGDGVLIDMSNVTLGEVADGINVEMPSGVTSCYCESMTSDATFLRSNTVLWRFAHSTFVLTIRDQRVRIVPESEILLRQVRQISAGPELLDTPEESIDDADILRISKSQFADRFEPSKIKNQDLRSWKSFAILLGNESSPSEIRNYLVTNTKFDRAAFESENYEELVVRYHVGTYFTNLTAAFKQLCQDVKPISMKMGRKHYAFVELRGMTTCLEEIMERPSGKLTWVETPLEKTAFSLCALEGGSLVQRTCTGDIYYGAHWGPMQALNPEGQLIDLSDTFICASPSETTSNLWSIFQAQQNATFVLTRLQQVTTEWNPIIAEVQLTALLFLNATLRDDAAFSQSDVDRATSIIQQVLYVDSQTLAGAQKSPSTSTNLLMGLEEILTRSTNVSSSTMMVSALRSEITELSGSAPFLFTANSSNFGELGDTVDNTRIIRTTGLPTDDFHEHDVAVKLTTNSLIAISAPASKIAFVYHPNIRLANAAVASRHEYADLYSPNPGDGDRYKLRIAKYLSNSAMVQVAVGGGPVHLLPEPVDIYFRPFRAVNTSTASNRSIVCAFWKPEVNRGNGGWSTQGCWYQGNVNGLDHCRCNHLSAFTVFIAYDLYGTTIHDSILDWITKVGCGLSLFGCIGVIATYTVFPKWRKPKPGFYGHHVIFHLSLALALFLSVFLGGFEQTQNDQVCLFIAAFLHYSMLVVFFWMLVEAYCHYLLFVKVLGPRISRFMLKASLFAWILPLFPVIVLLASNTQLYYYMDDNMYCWLTPWGFYYAVLPFVSLISCINLALYVLIIVKVRFAKSTIRSTQSQHSLTFISALVIFFIMGLSWIFGLLAVGHTRILFSYLFCIFNSLQGFAIFAHFIVKGNMAQEQWQNFIEGKTDRDKARDLLLAKIRSDKTSATTSGASSSSSAAITASSIAGEIKSRPRKPKNQQYETSEF